MPKASRAVVSNASVRVPALIATTITTLLAVQAATAAPAATDSLTEIVVTVRQRAESIQSVPASVSAFSASQIESLGIHRAGDFISQTPGVSIVNAAEVADSQVNIRGMNGARDAESNFALLIDGIQMTDRAALNREYLDLQQIEILKGPQGALYGRDAAAGAIIITTKKPGDQWEGKLKGSYAQDSTWSLSGIVDGPVSDTLGVSLSANYQDSDGYYRNRYYGGSPDVDYFKSWDVHGRAVWAPTSKLTLDGKVHVGSVDAGSISFNSLFHIPSLVGFLETAFGYPASAAAYADENVNGHHFEFDNNIKPYNNQDSFEASLKADYDLGWADLTAWTLYSDIENDLGADGTSGAFGFFFPDQQCIDTTAQLNAAGYQLIPPQGIGPTPAFSLFGAYTPTACDGTQYQRRDQNDFSMEVRLTSKSDQRLRWLAGLYYLTLDRKVAVNTGIDRGFGVFATPFTTDPRNPTEQLVYDKFNTDVYAAFGQLAYDVTDDVEASLALRYDREERKVNSLVPTVADGATATYINTCGDGRPQNQMPINPGLCATGTITPKSKTYDQLEPKVSLRWDATDLTSVYGTVGVGFKSGGFNNQGSAATIDLFINQPLLGPGGPFEGSGYAPVGTQDSYKKETSTSYELGLKSHSQDNRLRYELAAYYVDVDDMQFFEFMVGGFGLLRVVSNIDQVDIKGFEASINYAATDWLSVYAGFNRNMSEIKKNAVRPDSVGNASPYTPDYTANAGASVTYPMSAGMDFVGSIDVSWVGPTWFHVIQDNTRPTIFSLQFPLGPSDLSKTQRDAYALVNLRGGISTDRWSLVGFVDNALDKQWLMEVIPAPEFGGTFDHPGSERRVGVEATLKF